MRLAGTFAVVFLAGVHVASAQTTAPASSVPAIVLVCVPVTSGGSPTASCGTDPTSGAQLMAAPQPGYVLSAADYAALQLAEAPFDYGTAGGLFGLGLFLPLAGYLMSYPLGLLLRMLLSP